MNNIEYLMENEEESLRLDMKTDPAAVEEQARWAQVAPGMRVADLGCGSGKTTSVLHRLVQPGGTAVGVDFSKERVDFAREHYGVEGLEFVCRDIRQPCDDLGRFDLIWIRFVLEYYRAESMEILRNVSRLLNPGGILCLIDLDLNCLNHFGLSDRLERTIHRYARALEENLNFDAHVGRKLYSYLFDLDFQDISVKVGAHHVIYGALNSVDAFNWTKKLQIATKKIKLDIDEYEGGVAEFVEECDRFFADPRRFSYTPIVCAFGRRAAEEGCV